VDAVRAAASSPTGERNPDIGLRDLLARCVDCYGSLPATICDGSVVTWTELADRATRIANAICGRGVEPGDRIAVLQSNGPEIVEIAHAVALTGAVLVPVSPRLAAPEVQYLIADARAALVFAGTGSVGLEGLDDIVVRTQHADYDAFVEAGSTDPVPRVGDPSAAALQIYTSGTTGRPKGVVHSQRALVQNAFSVAFSQGLQHGDIYLTATPLTHAAGALRVYNLALDGVAHVILQRFDVPSFLDAIAEHGVTSTMLVPTMLRDLLGHPAIDAADLSSLRTVVYGSAPMPRELVHAALDRLPVGLIHGYGLTEGTSALTALGAEEHRRFALTSDDRLYSVGRPVPGVTARVVDGTGQVLGVNEEGALEVWTDKAMLEYAHQPEQTAAAFRHGWLITGDIARIDADGYVYVIGRAKDVIISGGVNVYPAEIERVLTEHPAVVEAVVLGARHPRWGEVPVAFVVGTSAPPETDDLVSHCRSSLASYKVPAAIQLINELPRNDVGKVTPAALASVAQDLVDATL
jgi:fatty-acyl-CoA synthase/long-chain acyl-CoA synthetase